jgi:ubiquitin carboxyl-terminal hydrolase 2/21
MDMKMRGVVGLANLGNTCYMNSALQALRHCPEWTICCKRGGELNASLQDADSNSVKIALAYQDLLQSLWAGTGPAYVKPMGFYEQLKKIVKGTIYDDFIQHTPQDAHEFLVWLLDQLYMASQKNVDIEIQAPEKLEKMNYQALCGWKAAFEKQYSPLTDLIFGMFRTQYICGNTSCSAIHARWETFNVLKVGLVKSSNGEINLTECIKEEFKDEEIDNYLCETCKTKAKATKTISIWRLPKVLILTLKRFTPMGTRENARLNYDGEPLCLDSLFSKESKEPTRNKVYNLFSTIDHHGNHMGGHYTSQSLSPIWKTWYRFDDESVYKLDKPHFGSETYIMMFR